MIRWDNLNDPAPDIRPLSTGQAAVQFEVVGNMMWSVDIWAKTTFSITCRPMRS